MKTAKLLAFGTAALFAAFASAQSNVAPDLKVSFPASGKHGAKLDGSLQVTFGPELHAYQNPASDPDLIPITVTVGPKTIKLKPVKYPAGTDLAVGGDPKPVKVYSGTIKIPLSIVLPTKKGSVKVSVIFHYQQCNMNSCYPPADATATATVTVK